MTFRSSKSVLSALLLLVSTGLAAPADASAEAEGGKKKPKEGFIRLWNLLPKGKDELRLVKTGGSDEGETLTVSEPMNYYAGYRPLPVGRYPLKVVRATDPMTALQTFDVVLREDVFVTFVAKPKGDKVGVEMVDDTYDPALATTGQIVVRQQFPDANVLVTNNTKAVSQVLAYGSEETLTGFPLQATNLTFLATFADGKRKTASMEVDFRKSRHASIIVMPDGYGRFRVRLASAGQNEN
jgi:hypothetical protein